MIEQLKNMKDILADCVAKQISGNLEKIETKELGEAIDMIKDLAKAIYYCTITEAMDQKEEAQRYAPQMTNYYGGGRTMYYDGRGNSMPGQSAGMGAMRTGGYPMLTESRDYREGRSPMYRKMYMEGKMINDKSKSMQELDNYMQELTSDLVDMIQDASPEEKQLLQQKINMLASKIK